MASCLVFKAQVTGNKKNDTECDEKFSEVALNLLNCTVTENTCSNQVWFEGAVSLLKQIDCVSAEEAAKAAGIIRDKIGSAGIIRDEIGSGIIRDEIGSAV